MRNLAQIFGLLLCFMVLGWAAVAASLTLEEAKAAGTVGERADGLIAVVNPPGAADVQALVSSVNEGRLQVYKQTAADQGTSIDAVRKIAAQRLFDLSAPGDYIQKNGTWVRK